MLSVRTSINFFFLVGLPESIQFTFYELYQEKKTVFLSIEKATMQPKSGKYVFDLSFLNHRDESLIYQCKYCIKAFSNSEFLVKHVCSVHVCTICLDISENYKNLATHMRSHKMIVCPFNCSKISDSPAQYRLHLKKQHLIPLPPQIGIFSLG